MTKIIAHRGARSIAPENTLEAAEIARKMGADLWETDVSVTRDGRLILFHDYDLLRTTDALNVFPDRSLFTLDQFDLDDLMKLDLGRTFIERDPFSEIASGNIPSDTLRNFEGDKIPTLEETLGYTKKTDWPINLELKDQVGELKNFPLPEKVVDMIKSSGVDPGLIIISSFNHLWLDRVNSLFPELEIQALVGEYPDYELTWSDYNFNTYNIDFDMNDFDGVVETLKEKGKKINVFTVNSEVDMLKLISDGIDGIFTDYPQKMKKLIKL